MEKHVKEIAEKAGFIMWENEQWKPPGAVVDWSCQYDAELQRFYELVVESLEKTP